MQTLHEYIIDKGIKPKEKTELISKQLLDKTLSIDALIEFASTAKESPKATCMEALEHATLAQPEISNENTLRFATQSLQDKAPRVKWESARVIGNIAHLYPKNLNNAITHLLTNTEHTGTVVRWSAAFALCKILKLKTQNHQELLPAIQSIVEREEKNSIKKMYLLAMKKL